jgi:hypothetical protein
MFFVGAIHESPDNVRFLISMRADMESAPTGEAEISVIP